MATTKLQFYSQLAEHSTGQLTKSRENWTSYLTTAARLYKYPFDEQVMIYTQRPDATACAPLETWNDPMNRSVKRGAKGIALIYEIGGEQKLRYVFDFSDTESGWRGRDPKRPNIWEMQKEHEVPVMDALVKAYGDMEGTLADMLHNIAYELAEDYYNNNADDIAYSLKNSFLESYDEYDVKVAFREAVTVSTGYSLMSRCGLNPDEFYEDEDFNCIFDFNTLNTVNAMGTAVSQLSEQVLREIETAIKKHERNKTAERSTEYASDNLNVQQEWGLYASQRNTQGTIGRTDREIRIDAAESHQEQPQDILQFSASAREIETTSTGNRPNSGTPLRAVDERINGEEPAPGQSDRPNGMGSAHEQPESDSGGIYTGRTDLQLNNQTEGAAKETAPFSMSEDELAQLHIEWSDRLVDSVIRDESVMNAVLNSDMQNTLDEIKTAVRRIHSEIRQDILDSEFIQNKGYHVNELDKYINRDRIPPLDERLYAKVIESEEYKRRVDEATPNPVFIANDNDVYNMDLSSYRDGDIIGYNAKGVEFSLMRMGEHTFINTTTKMTPWGEILGADNVPSEILSQIRNANKRETEAATPLEQEKAELNADSSAEQSAGQENPENTSKKQEYKYYSVRRPVDIGTYPREINPTEIVNFDRRQPVENGLFEAWGYLIYPQPLTDAQIWDYELRAEPISIENQPEINGSQFGVNLPENQDFISLTNIEQSGISLDTVDAMLRDGGNKSNSVMRIAAHYMKGKTPDENADFIMNEYGSGGKGLRIGNQRYAAWFDETGFTIAEGPSVLYPLRMVRLTWEQVESRVRELMYNGQYMPQHRLDAVPDFERKELADKLWNLYRDTDSEYRPNIADDILRGGFPDATAKLAERLSQPQQLESIISELRDYCTAYEQNPEMLNYRRLHNPQELLQRLSDLRTTPITFTANVIPNKSVVPFITDDDIHDVLTQGSRFAEGKFRIYSYFLHEHTSKEKADFLKDEYGTGGGTHAIFRADNSYENHDSKGIEISRGSIFEPDSKVLVPWSRAARLIDSFINEGRFMSRAELDRLPAYEMTILAREIARFYNDLPEDMPRPFQTDKQPYHIYTDNEISEICGILAEPQRVEALIESMRPIWEVTPPEDKYYDNRQKAYADLTAYRDGTFTLFPQLSAIEQFDENKPSMSNTVLPFEQINRQNEQLTLFEMPSYEEQQATIAKAVEKRQNAAESPAFSIPVIEQADIDEAIRNWNGDRDSKILVNEYMRENDNARALKTAELLKQEYSGDLTAFTVTKDGAESVVLPWPKVQKRIAQLVGDEQFLTPDELTYLNNELNETWNRLAAENTGREIKSAANNEPERTENSRVLESANGSVADENTKQPFMVIDNIARNNYNLFALAFPQIVNGSYRSMDFRNEQNKHELNISHDTTNAGLIHFEISYYKPDATRVYAPTITFEANFENRMLKPIQYANTLTGEDIGLLSIPSPDDAQRLDALGIGIYELLAGIKNQGFELSQTDVFHNAEGNPLPAEPKSDIVAFLKEQANRESAAHYNVLRNMPGVAVENSQQQNTTEQTAGQKQSAEYLSTDLTVVSPLLRETITNHLLNSTQKNIFSDYVTKSNATNKQITDMLSTVCGYIANTIQLSDGSRAYYSTNLQGITVGLRDNSADEQNYTWDEIAPIIRNMHEQGLDGFGISAPEAKQAAGQKQSEGLTNEDIRYLRSRVIITEFAEGEVVTTDSLIADAVNAASDEQSNRITAGKVLQAAYGQRIDPIDYFNRNYASGYDFTQACIIRGYIETAVDIDTFGLRALPESERMPRPFPITSREWQNVNDSDKEDSPYTKGLLLMRNHFANLMPVVIDDENGYELHQYHYQTEDKTVVGSVLAYSEQEAARMIPYENYSFTNTVSMRETPVVYYTPEKHIPYRDGDVIATISFQAVINRIYSGYVYYNIPEESPDEYRMEQSQLEENLDRGTHKIIGQESSAPEQTAREYAVSDSVYLENDRHFVIDRIGGSEINLRDTSLPISVSRTIGIADFEALLQENPRNNHLLVTGVTQSEMTARTTAFPDGIPITKAVVDIFAQSKSIYYANHTNGALYISNGFYIMKTTEQDLASLTAQINSRRRKTPDIEVVENQRLAEYIDNANGTFELLQKPYELGGKNDRSAYVYADEKQYFEYDKQYVGLFENDGIRMFVNDNASYDINSHSMIVKDRDNSVLGIVLPISIPDELYVRLADVLPLKSERKSEIERIKENPSNDPYIGREFFDGRDNYIVSGISKRGGVDMYTVPTVENGKISRSALFIKTDEIENQIGLWERNRGYAEQQKAADELKAQEEAVKKSEYENTNGYADSLPPMQKANVLKALNGGFPTNDYGDLSVKRFIEAAVADGKWFETHNELKKKYAEMDGNAYVRELNFRERTEAWGKYRAALTNFETEDSPNALWLRENHPFLYHKLYYDLTVLDSSYLTLEYRLMMAGDVFYPISKTAYDYGNYLINSGILSKQPKETVITGEAPVSETSKETTALSSFERHTQAKEKYPEHIALAKLGDFYELYGADAQYAADTFGYTVISRRIDGQEIPIVGIPDKNLDEFINRTNALGRNAVLVNGYGAMAEYPSDGADPDYKYERYTVATTSDAFDDPYIIWDNTTEDYYVTDDGSYATFEIEADAKEYCNFLAQKEADGREPASSHQLEQTSEQRYIVEPLTDTEDIIIQSALINPIPENAVIYGIKDTQTDTFLKNDDGSYEFYLSEMAASATADQLSEMENYGLQAQPTIVAQKPQPQNRINFHITDNHLGEGSTKIKYGYNVAAIRLLKQVEAENRLATPAEQEILSRYVGWGGLSQVFNKNNKDWQKEYDELQALLTPNEYDKAQASTLNAHYTSPVVIKAIYEAVERMGFKTGNILEPACGVGNFFGLLPESMKNAKMYGVELDSVTGRIAKQLYQKADITVSGFEKTDMPDNFFDLAIGNVPFGDYKLADKRYDKHSFAIHDYFFAKTLDQVRPGGVVAFVTSKYTLDKQNPAVRKYIAQRAELLGAVRLPNDAFLKNAGTETATDIIFLQRRDRLIDIEPDWVHLGIMPDTDGIPVNSYFAENPEMVLGTMALDERMNNKYGRNDMTTCYPIPGADLSEQLRTALVNIKGEITEPELDDVGEKVKPFVMADARVKNFSYALVTPSEDGTLAEKIGEGEVYYRENSRMYPVELSKTALERVKGMIALRDCAYQLIDYQLQDYSNEDIVAKQSELNNVYDEYTKKYGLLNSRGNSLAFSNDSSYFLLCSLEILDENGDLDRKADMFTKRTIKQKTVITSVDTASEALAVSIGEKACIDLSFMAQLMGGGDKIEDIVNDLQGVIFKDPVTGPFDINGEWYKGWQTADEYLSGNVRQKLEIARAAAEKYPEFAVNVEALQMIQPKDLEASEIAVKLGTTWIDKRYIQQFVYELLETSDSLQNVIQVNYSERTGEWGVSGKSRVPSSNVLANITYGTTRMNAYEIIHDTLNLKDVRVYDTVLDENDKEKRVLNKKETTLAAQRQVAIKQKFKDWIWKDPERRQDLVRLYNDKFNSNRPREYDGKHINFNGISPEISLRSHQLNAIAHILYGGNTLLAHEVGAGKTFEMVAAAMESKRLGLCQKSMFAVPNHLTEQTASEFLRLYPSANLLVATAKDFETKNRKKFCAKISTGDYDAIILGHSQLEKIPLSKERQERLVNKQIQEIEDGIEELRKNDGEYFSIKQLEKTKKNLEARLVKLMDGKSKDSTVTFEQLGVDRLFVDEAHNFKNLFLYTKMRNVAGLSQTEAQKSSDLFVKCRYIDELTDNKGVIFATGTPISNSMTELYTMQRYLQYEALQDLNMEHFDSWASSFGETVTAIELAPEGSGYRARTRFSKFDNLPELMCMFKDVADIKTADMLDLPRPNANFHTVVAEPTEIQKEMITDLSKRAKAVHEKMVKPHIDNMLKITSDGRKIGLDQRLINDMLPDDRGSKVNLCMNNVYKIWDDSKADRLTQLVFCDFSTPNNDGRFNVYDDIRAKLLEKGIPQDEIAFIHEANTETRKKELFAKVRQGKVRILFGSTFKMGSGTNVQDRLIAIHDLDCPWRPSDLEQRAGRIIRQGNMNPEVYVFRYVTESTFDAYLYQTIENKQKFISQIMSSKSPVRSCEDVDETALSYAEIKALCAGNPLIREKMDLDIEVARLKLLKSDYQSQHYRLEDNLLKRFPEGIKQEESAIIGYKADIQHLANETILGEDGFSPMEIHGVTYDEKGQAGAALLEAFKTITTTEPHKIGSYRGFEMSLSYSTMFKQYSMTLKANMSYSVDLGNDAFGNIARIDNLLKTMPTRLDNSMKQLENLNQQVKNAHLELETPFQFELELSEKSERLAALDAELNMDKSGEEITDLDDDFENDEDNEPDDYQDFEQDSEPEAENKRDGKTSILDGLKNKPVSLPERTEKEKITACI